MAIKASPNKSVLQTHFANFEARGSVKKMVNLHRGEIEGVLDGVPRRLVLTLGALAELESAFGDEDMVALAVRFESGCLASADCIKVIACGLRGAGASVSDDEVGRMQADGGVTGFVDIVARLLTATFGGAAAANGTAAATGVASGGGDATQTPFPGTT
jgi:Phage tail tube protein, GTA-gp10